MCAWPATTSSSGNLANVDTPGYKPKDVDFQAAMASAEGAPGAAGQAGARQHAGGHPRRRTWRRAAAAPAAATSR